MRTNLFLGFSVMKIFLKKVNMFINKYVVVICQAYFVKNLQIFVERTIN